MEIDKYLLEGMAKACYAIEWAAAVDEAKSQSLSGIEIMDVLPMPVPDIYDNWARSLYNKIGIEAIDAEIDRLDPDTEEFGHYIAMQALGTGCRWDDSHPPHTLTVPSIEGPSYQFLAIWEDGKEILSPTEPPEYCSISRIICRGHKLDFWDDGFGPVYAYQETLGIVGCARAQTWEEAYECIVDEIMADAEPIEGWDADEKAAYEKDGTLPEGCHFRGSGIPSNPKLKEMIAQEDLNGNFLSQVDPKFANEHQLEIYWKRDV